MTYSDKVWKDSPDHTTPLSAAGLNDWEARIKAETDALSALAASNTAAIAQQAPPLASGLMAKLNKGQLNACISVMTDSTGRNDTATGSPATGWVRRAADYLAGVFPAYTVNYYDGAASGSFDIAYGAATVVQTGTAGGASPVLSIYNAAIGGVTAKYFGGTRIKTAVTDLQPDLVLLSFGHNNTTDTTLQWWNPLLTLAESVLAAAPCELGLITQNPAVTPSANTTQQQARASDVLRVGKITGATVVDVCQAFIDTGAVASYVNADGVHPNSLGQALWAATVTAALIKGAQVRPQTPAGSGLHKAGSNLARNGAMVVAGGALAGWTLANVTVSQDTTNYERTAQGHAAKLTHTATTGYGAYITQALDVKQCKGRWVTAIMRYYAPSGQTVDATLGRIGIGDGVKDANHSVILPNAADRDGFATMVCSLLVDPAATAVAVDIYVDSNATADGIGANITVQDVVVVLGPEPRGLILTDSTVVTSPVALTSGAAAETPLTVTARAAGQTADLVRIYDTLGALGSRVLGNNGLWEFTKGANAIGAFLWLVGSATAALIVGRTGDTASLGRFYINSDGKLSWNGSASANSHDVNLYRSAADVLKTDDQFLATDGIVTKYLSAAGKTTVVDADFTATPPNGTLCVHRDTTASKTYLSVRANAAWTVMAGPL